jgi:photosynthetic reaction center cytochrome c subunit
MLHSAGIAPVSSAWIRAMMQLQFALANPNAICENVAGCRIHRRPCRAQHGASVSRPFRRALVPVAAVLALVATPHRAAAQMPEKFENLQVLPKDIPRDTLLRIMRGFAVSLGVRCEFCHVPREGAAPGPNGQPQMNFAADDKPEKKNARVMLRMVQDINGEHLPRLADRADPPLNVQCVTCHRGLSRPMTLDVALERTIGKSGVDSAIRQYRGLRASSAMSGRYDFSEMTVNDLAARLGAAGKTAEAIALLQMNQEFYPSSGQIDFAMGELYRQSGDKDKAIVAYRAALVKQPQNRQARARLTELGVAP